MQSKLSRTPTMLSWADAWQQPDPVLWAFRQKGSHACNTQQKFRLKCQRSGQNYNPWFAFTLTSTNALSPNLLNGRLETLRFIDCSSVNSSNIQKHWNNLGDPSVCSWGRVCFFFWQAGIRLAIQALRVGAASYRSSEAAKVADEASISMSLSLQAK